MSGTGATPPLPPGARWPFPYVDLFPKPTPFDPLRRFAAALGGMAAGAGHDPQVDVWVKRDDLMAVGLGGNKLRNLEFHVATALDRGADTLVAWGRGSANHCRLTAAAAARAGLRCVLVLSGPPPATPGPNERLARLFGAELRYASDAEPATRDALLADVLADLRRRGSTPYEIPVGASGAIGASGQVLAGFELARQLAELRLAADHIFVGAATGGTYAGIRVALRLAGLSTAVVAVPTYLSTATSPAEFAEHVASLTAELRDRWIAQDATNGTPGPDDVPLVDDLSRWRPFGARPPESLRAARLLARTEGIALDPVYSARTAAALVAWAAAGRLAGKTAVLWIAGGTPALFEPGDAVEMPDEEESVPRRSAGESGRHLRAPERADELGGTR